MTSKRPALRKPHPVGTRVRQVRPGNPMLGIPAVDRTGTVVHSAKVATVAWDDQPGSIAPDSELRVVQA